MTCRPRNRCHVADAYFVQAYLAADNVESMHKVVVAADDEGALLDTQVTQTLRELLLEVTVTVRRHDLPPRGYRYIAG